MNLNFVCCFLEMRITNPCLVVIYNGLKFHAILLSYKQSTRCCILFSKGKQQQQTESPIMSTKSIIQSKYPGLSSIRLLMVENKQPYQSDLRRLNDFPRGLPETSWTTAVDRKNQACMQWNLNWSRHIEQWISNPELLSLIYNFKNF